jgi:hypothetical protein
MGGDLGAVGALSLPAAQREWHDWHECHMESRGVFPGAADPKAWKVHKVRKVRPREREKFS